MSWHALVAPAATPRAVVNRLHSEMTRILKLPEVSKAITNLDLIPAAQRGAFAKEDGEQVVDHAGNRVGR